MILDIVFNHTGEGDERGATFCWRGLDNPTYYLLDPKTGRYLNYSGCGNTMNCNHPVVRHQILAALRYWVTEMHVDGFRFDLASILGRGRDGEVLPNPPLIESIAADPVMADVKLIAEAWDAAGLYQVGSFPSWGRWAEWNGRFRDEVRHFVKSDPGMTRLLAQRLAGSPDLYRGSARAPWHSINFITSHDGFTLADLVSYNEKHNWENGEGNVDGHDDNVVLELRRRGPLDRPRGAGAPAAAAAELPRAAARVAGRARCCSAATSSAARQRGNNNAYCQDNETSWLDWTLAEKNAELARFVARLVRFRKAHASLRRRTFFEDEADPPLAWHGAKLGKPDWEGTSRALGMQLTGRRRRRPDLRLRERALAAHRVRAATAAGREDLAPLPGHQPAAGQGRARARVRGAARRRAHLPGGAALRRDPGREVTTIVAPPVGRAAAVRAMLQAAQPSRCKRNTAVIEILRAH